MITTALTARALEVEHRVRLVAQDDPQRRIGLDIGSGTQSDQHVGNLSFGRHVFILPIAGHCAFVFLYTECLSCMLNHF
jgi:hypothetical protein